MEQERVDEGAIGVTRRWVDHQTRLLVHDEEIGILELDIDGNVLGLCLEGDRVLLAGRAVTVLRGELLPPLETEETE